jgi:hypothetical protein
MGFNLRSDARATAQASGLPEKVCPWKKVFASENLPMKAS